MSLSIKINNEDFPADHKFSIDGLGVFENGKAREVTNEEEQAFVTERGIAVRDAFTSDSNVEISGTATAKVPKAEETTTGAAAEEEKGGES